MLASKAFHPRGDKRTVFVHGFTQNGNMWSPIIDLLGSNYRAISIDLPGHGLSSSISADLVETSDQLVELIMELSGSASYIGYSLGARVCLHAALRHPNEVERLVICSGTPGIEDDSERAARREDDNRLAEHIENIGVAAFLHEWLAQPLFSGLKESLTNRAEREKSTPTGLANSLRLMGTGTQLPLWAQLHELAMPVLIVTGANDHKFTEIGVRMAATIGPNAMHRVIPNTGHAVPLERPDALAAAIDQFMRQTPVTNHQAKALRQK